MRKKIYAVSVILLVILTGCSGNGRRSADRNTSNTPASLTTEATTEVTTEATTEVTTEATTEVTTEATTEETTEVVPEDIEPDVDLTVMSSDMVYATVSDMMTNPDSYLGKTVRVAGPYYPMYYEDTGKYYHYVIITDALACCKSGLEFIWDGGNTHSYPDDYPKENDNIEITGTYSSYVELGYTYYYIDTKNVD